MSKSVIVAILGVLVTLIPIDGLPERVSTILTVCAGATIAMLGILMRYERLWLVRSLRGGHRTDAYSENGTPKREEPRD